MSGPLVTVVVPFLDPPVDFFRQALAGVAEQSFEDWELILVDDGSAAPAREIAERAAQTLPRTRVIDSGPGRPLGISGARNAGWREARGELVAMLDADDVWLPERLAVHVAALRSEPETAMACSDTLYWSSWREGVSGEEDFVPEMERVYGRFEPPDFAAEMLRGAVPVPCPTAVTVRRSMLETIGGFEASWAPDRATNSLYEDQVFYVKLGSRHPVLRIEAVLDRYRLHGDSVMGSATAQMHAESRRAFLAWCRTRGSAGVPPRQRGRLEAAVSRAEWDLRHPVLAGWRRRVRKAMRRLAGAS